MEQKSVSAALSWNLDWFRSSGIMMPSDGIWGVAERIFQVSDPALKDKVFQSFNSWTDYGDWSVIESRRPDCNFQAAYLFLLASEAGMDTGETGEHLLEFLYCRSGLLNRLAHGAPAGAWNWSHTQWCTRLWLDDNAWSLLIPLMIERMFPKLSERYQMRRHAADLTRSLWDGFKRSFLNPEFCFSADCYDPQNVWMGRPRLPHWGALCCMALAFAHRAGLAEGMDVAGLTHQYCRFLLSSWDSFNVSEAAYALIGSSACAGVFPEDPLYLQTANAFAGRILEKMDLDTGNVPAEHYEAPIGAHLVDTIYTVNWVLLGMQCILHLNPAAPYQSAYEKILSLILKIQDRTDSPVFHGCWRGMYDLKAGAWGGGDSYEGGAGSTYSGWTNAPIGIALANHLMDRSLLD